jgi:L-threonylcarbamoyladenylate synthase
MIDDITKAFEVLKKGGVILYPTDTIWGIGCDATNADAVARIYALKQREETKSMLVLVENADRIGRHVKEVPELAWQLIEVNDQPMTVIYPGAVNLASNLINADKTIGIRVVNDEFCQKLISKLNRPIVSTSANISGQPSPALFDEISDEIKNGVDYIVIWRQDDLTKRPPSQILKIGLKGEIEVLRK